MLGLSPFFFFFLIALPILFKLSKPPSGPRRSSCHLIDLRSTMSLGNNKDCSTASATYLIVPRWKSQMEASSRRGAPSNSIRGAQTGVATWWSTLFPPSVVDLVCIVQGCLAPLWGLVSLGGWFFPPSITSFPLPSLFLF